VTISYVGAGAVSESTGAATPAYPAGLAANDILILGICGDPDGAADGQGDFGGTVITTRTSGGILGQGCRITLYWKRAVGTESGTITTDDAGDATIANITAWRGCLVGATPIDQVASGGSASQNTSVTLPAITPSEENTMVICWHTAGDNWAAENPIWSRLASVTQPFDHLSAVGFHYEYTLVYGIKASTTDTLTGNLTQQTSEDEANITINLLNAEVIAPPPQIIFIGA